MICWWSKNSGEEKKPGAVSRSLKQRMDSNNIVFLKSMYTVKLSVMEIV